MNQFAELDAALDDPKSLEDLYQQARSRGATAQFTSELVPRHNAAPDNTDDVRRGYLRLKQIFALA